MEVAMTEQGTLKELNVKPVDVVEYTAIGEKYMTPTVFTFAGWVDGIPYDTTMNLGDNEKSLRTDEKAIFRIICRAAQPAATHDLTAITTPFGLLDEATQEALRAHGGPYEYWNHLCKWTHTDGPAYDCKTVYRVKPAPEIKKEKIKAMMTETGSIFAHAEGDGQALIVTFNRINGVIDLASYRVEPR